MNQESFELDDLPSDDDENLIRMKIGNILKQSGRDSYDNMSEIPILTEEMRYLNRQTKQNDPRTGK